MTSDEVIITIESIIIFVISYFLYLQTIKYRFAIKFYQKKIDKQTVVYLKNYMMLQLDYKNYLENNKLQIEGINQRLNVISKENNKLREQNELMQERLRNLGIKDFDVI